MLAVEKITSPICGRVPRHVAIIMDGNGRWAKLRGKLRASGHQAGVKAVYRSVRFAMECGIEALTLFVFSRENWRRPEEEVSSLISLFDRTLATYADTLKRHNVRLKVIGDLQRFSSSLQRSIARAEALTADKTGLTLTIAANYSGQWDIVQAARKLAMLVQNAELKVEEIDESIFAHYLSLHGLPEVDLLIRTSGEYRLSNFLLWQVAYAELYFVDTLWPDFDDDMFKLALESFAQRERRFGDVSGSVG